MQIYLCFIFFIINSFENEGYNCVSQQIIYRFIDVHDIKLIFSNLFDQIKKVYKCVIMCEYINIS